MNHWKHKKSALAASMTMLWASLPAGAQTQGEAQAAELPEIIVQEQAWDVGYQPRRTTMATRTDVAIRDVPQAVVAVPQQVLQDSEAQSIDEALHYVSGITQANTLGGTQDALIKRGFGFNRDGSILRDGVRTVLARNFAYSVERVEVLKGPSSILYGAMEHGGVINMVTKKPQLEFSAQGALSASSLGGGGAQADITGPIGNNGLAYRLIAEGSKTDYWRNYGVNRKNLLAPSLAWYGRDTWLRTSWEHIRYEQPFDRGTVFDFNAGRPVAVNPRIRFDEEYNRTIGDSDFFTVQASHALDARWKLGATYSFNRNRYDDYQARAVGYNADTGELTRRPDGTRGALSQQHVLQLTMQGNVRLGNASHEILAGLDAEDSNIYRRDLLRGRNTGGFNIYDPVYGRLPHSTDISPENSDQRDLLKQQALFVQDSVRFSPRWGAQLGGRFLRYDQFAGKGRPFIAGTFAKDTVFVPRVGIVWQPDSVQSVYASHSRSLKPQSVIREIAVKTLAPEKGNSWELGYKLDLPRGLTLTAAAYHLRKQNIIVNNNINGLNVPRTAGAARSRGFELDVAGQVARNWDVIASYAWTDAVVTDDPQFSGHRLPNVARRQASIFAAHDFSAAAPGSSRWRAGGGLRHVGRRAGDDANSFHNAGYAVLDAFAACELPWGERMLRVQLSVKNLLDKNYVTSSANQFRLSLGERRSATLRLVMDW